jgi:hypothetical protein
MKARCTQRRDAIATRLISSCSNPQTIIYSPSRRRSTTLDAVGPQRRRAIVPGQAVLTKVRVEDLPAPHHLFKCRYADRSGALIERYQDDPGRAGSEFLATLTEQEAARCRYHQADWRKVAPLSVAVLARMQEGQRRDKAIMAISRRFKLSDRDKSELHFLFADPICGIRYGRARQRPASRVRLEEVWGQSVHRGALNSG